MTTVRINTIEGLGKEFPTSARYALGHYFKHCKERGTANISFYVDALPKSLNHQYGRGRGGHSYLKPEVKAFRELTMSAIGPRRHYWKPTGVVSAIVFFESPNWVTKKRTIREMDCDNKIKPLLDAIQAATKMKDERIWDVLAFKIPSKRERTTAYLFDLGPVVDFYL